MRARFVRLYISPASFHSKLSSGRCVSPVIRIVRLAVRVFKGAFAAPMAAQLMGARRVYRSPDLGWEGKQGCDSGPVAAPHLPDRGVFCIPFLLELAQP